MTFYSRFPARFCGACAMGGLLITTVGSAHASSEIVVSDATAAESATLLLTTAPVENEVAPGTSVAEPETRFVAAEPAPPSAETTAKAEAATEEPRAPERFRKALRERDISFGYGRKVPISRLDGRSDVTLFQFLPRWGRFHDERQEFLWEVPITYADSPHSALAVGVTLMYRYHFTTRRGIAPFIEGGSGIVLTNLNDKVKELGGHFQFSPQAGAGFRAAIGKKSDLVFAARWYHLSNASLRKPNAGLNNYLITVGYSQLF